jgi:hypothetical protein
MGKEKKIGILGGWFGLALVAWRRVCLVGRSVPLPSVRLFSFREAVVLLCCVVRRRDSGIGSFVWVKIASFLFLLLRLI